MRLNSVKGKSWNKFKLHVNEMNGYDNRGNH